MTVSPRSRGLVFWLWDPGRSMCESHDSQPPVVATGAGVGSSGDFHLEAADGNRPMAYFARAAVPRRVGVVVIHAKLGLLPFYKTLTERLAEVGIDGVTLDLYGRTAGDGARDDHFDHEPHYEVVRRREARTEVDIDVRAAVDFLTSEAGGAVDSVFTLGFCFGGSVSWWQSAVEPRVSGCIGLYGAPWYAHDLVSEMRAPLLLLIAGADAFVSAEKMSDFQNDLTAADVPFEARTYPGAPHSFFDRRYREHAGAAGDAWDQILGFITRHSTPA